MSHTAWNVAVWPDSRGPSPSADDQPNPILSTSSIRCAIDRPQILYCLDHQRTLEVSRLRSDCGHRFFVWPSHRSPASTTLGWQPPTHFCRPLRRLLRPAPRSVGSLASEMRSNFTNRRAAPSLIDITRTPAFSTPCSPYLPLPPPPPAARNGLQGAPAARPL